MAVTTVTPTVLNKDIPSADMPVTAGTAINPANSMLIAYPKEGKLLLILNNTAAAVKAATVKAGDFSAKALGDLAVSMAQDDVQYLIVSSDRFKKQDGSINITFETGMTGFLLAFYLP